MASVQFEAKAIESLRDDLRKTDRALAECAGSVREVSAILRISQEHNDRRLGKLEKVSYRLLIGVLLLSGGGAAVGPIVAKLLGG